MRNLGNSKNFQFGKFKNVYFGKFQIYHKFYDFGK